MDASEKSLLVKIIEGLAISEKAESPAETEIPIFKKEPKEYIEKLRKRNSAFAEKDAFKPGDVIVWKEGMKNKRIPEYDQPSIVIKNINPSKIDQNDSYYEELDIILGFITDDDEFLVFNYDSKRFKVYTP